MDAYENAPESKTTAEKKGHGKVGFIVLLIVVIIGCIGIGVLIGSKTDIGLAFDSRASDGSFDPGMSDEEILEQLQKAADESMFSFRINGRPEFENGESEGALLIENPSSNKYYMRVTIKLDETGEVIYKTDYITPGKGIDLDKLEAVLPKGEYPATAEITAYDPDKKEDIGQTMAGLTIVIES